MSSQLGRKLAADVQAILRQQGDKPEHFLYRELKSRHPSDYSRMKEKVLLKQIAGVRKAFLKAAGDASANKPSDPSDGGMSDVDSEEEAAAEMYERQLMERPAASLNTVIAQGYKQSSSQPGTDAAPDGEVKRRSSPSNSTSAKARSKKRRLPGSPASEDKEASKGGKLPAPNDLEFLFPRPIIRYSDVGGLGPLLPTLRQLVELPLRHPELYAHLGAEVPRGVLLHGASGTGKTMVVDAIAGELGLPYLKISAPEVIGGMSGESESKLRDVFNAAQRFAKQAGGALLFLDEIDAITPKRDTSTRGMDKRIVAQLITCLDSLSTGDPANRANVAVIGATSRPDALEGALRRAGRFDREVCLPVPDHHAREEILRILLKNMKLNGDICIPTLAKCTPGYVGADLVCLVKEASNLAIQRVFDGVKLERLLPPIKQQESKSGDVEEEEESTEDQEKLTDRPDTTPQLTREELDPLSLTMQDLTAATKVVQPTAKREGFATAPDVTWKDVGALGEAREALSLSMLEPIRFPERFEALGLPLPAGIMLYGPPGCGKTLLAKAVANESGANFISVKGPELLDKFVGESEKAVRRVFERARASAPCVIFFDEMDALAPRRGSSGESGGGVAERVVNQLLTELDGLEARRSVFIVAATNRPELIDPAMLRPGRLDKRLYVPLPSVEDRLGILKAVTRKARLHEDVNLSTIAADVRMDGFSGADIAALVREAGLAVLRRLPRPNLTGEEADDPTPMPDLDLTALSIHHAEFETALSTVKPSVSEADRLKYASLQLA